MHFFSVQTLDVHRKLNCCTGILLESFDQLKAVASSKEGLLYGVPVSIKENIEYKVAFLLSCLHLLLDATCTIRNVRLVHIELAVTLLFVVDIVAVFACFALFPYLQHKGHDCSCGVLVNLDQPAEEDSVIVKVLKRQGAIPFVKTNIPQALLK